MSDERKEFEAALLAYDEAYESSDYEMELRGRVLAIYDAAIARAEVAEIYGDEARAVTAVRWRERDEARAALDSRDKTLRAIHARPDALSHSIQECEALRATLATVQGERDLIKRMRDDLSEWLTSDGPDGMVHGPGTEITGALITEADAALATPAAEPGAGGTP